MEKDPCLPIWCRFKVAIAQHMRGCYNLPIGTDVETSTEAVLGANNNKCTPQLGIARFQFVGVVPMRSSDVMQARFGFWGRYLAQQG
jgi:hypothetical protein